MSCTLPFGLPMVSGGPMAFRQALQYPGTSQRVFLAVSSLRTTHLLIPVLPALFLCTRHWDILKRMCWTGRNFPSASAFNIHGDQYSPKRQLSSGLSSRDHRRQLQATKMMWNDSKSIMFFFLSDCINSDKDFKILKLLSKQFQLHLCLTSVFCNCIFTCRYFPMGNTTRFSVGKKKYVSWGFANLNSESNGIRQKISHPLILVLFWHFRKGISF